MQQFLVTMLVTVNTVETASPAEVEEYLEGYLSEIEIGTAAVESVDEV